MIKVKTVLVLDQDQSKVVIKIDGRAISEYPIKNVTIGDIPILDYLKKKCECGAEKALGIRPYQAGHSSWCPVVERDYDDEETLETP